MSGNLTRSSHAAAQCTYYFEWCPKYRFNMFRKEKNQQMCETLLREVAARHRIEILELFVMPDHVHVVVKIPIDMSPSRALMYVKNHRSIDRWHTAVVQTERWFLSTLRIPPHPSFIEWWNSDV